MLNDPQASTLSIFFVHRSINQKHNIHVHKSFRVKQTHYNKNIYIVKSIVFKYTFALNEKRGLRETAFVVKVSRLIRE